MTDLKSRTGSYTQVQIEDARVFLEELKKIPKDKRSQGLLLTERFMEKIAAGRLPDPGEDSSKGSSME